MGKGGFSWKRATGISAVKTRISRKIGMPFTKSGRQRKVGKVAAGGGCLTSIIIIVLLFILLSSTILLLPGQAFALKATTVKDSIACVSQEALNEMTQFRLAKDKDSFLAYLETGKCIVVGDGHDVTVTESPGMFGTTAAFVYKGVKLWTPRESLRNYRAE
jgi:hypothetical protein